MRDGGKGALVVRPESITGTAPADELDALVERGWNAVPAHVRELRYFGAERKVWLTIADGTVTLVNCPADHISTRAPSDVVTAAWPVSAGKLAGHRGNPHRQSHGDGIHHPRPCHLTSNRRSRSIARR